MNMHFAAALLAGSPKVWGEMLCSPCGLMPFTVSAKQLGALQQQGCSCDHSTLQQLGPGCNLKQGRNLSTSPAMTATRQCEPWLTPESSRQTPSELPGWH